MATPKRPRKAAPPKPRAARPAPPAAPINVTAYDPVIPTLPLSDGLASDEASPVTTGRYIVVFKEGATAVRAVQKTLRAAAGLRSIASSSDFADGGIPAEDMAGAAHFEKLGIAVITGEEEMAALAASTADSGSPILAIEPEYVAQLSDAAAGTAGALPLEYLRGYRDAVNELYERLTKGDILSDLQAAGLTAALADTGQHTWGLEATRAHTARHTGQGVRIAVLDTGMDLDHPDYLGRPITSKSFTAVPVQDIHGHGTHCIGTACGPLRPATGVRRYGVATAAQIFAAKVFDNAPRPSAGTTAIISAIEWALAQGCAIASLSLGVRLNQKIAQYEIPMQRALAAGLLIVAAAGNNAGRPDFTGFVEPPANADAVMAVAAVDSSLRIAAFSGRSSTVTGVGGKVNIAAPGVRVFSSVPVGHGRHDFMAGTSMATPHVAGIAALWAQATGLRGAALWNKLVQAARPLNLPATDGGAGLVQAPA